MLLDDVSEGFISITDQRFTQQFFCDKINTGSLLAVQGEREVYKIKWKGGGGLTVRIL